MKYGVEIVIAAIILVLILFVIGYIIRKKYYKEIDRLESKKIELMERPVTEEMAKVKKLNMTGQTEEMFERWRHTWDEILTVHLPNIDEMLFYAEEYTDKYKFKQAKQTHERIESMLINIDEEIEVTLQELAELLDSEEKSRTDIEGLLEQYRTSKKNLLAHRHTFGIAATSLEELLNSIGDKVEKYDALTNDGNYLEARQVVVTLSTEMEQLVTKMEKIPDLLTEIQTVIPSQKNELAEGYKEMEQQGFILEHLSMEMQLEQLDKDLERYGDCLKGTEVDEVDQGVHEMKEKIDVLYDLLEKEVYAKHHVLQENEKAEFILDQLQKVNAEIKEETHLVQNSYQLLENELGAPHKFEKSLNQLTKRYELLKAKITEEVTAYTLLSEELKEIDEQLKIMQIEQDEFTEKLQNLRKDELEVRANLSELQKKIKDIMRLVKQSHIPGLPSDFESLYDQAEEQIEDVYKSLNEKPLNIKSIQKFLYDATDTVDHLYKRTEEHIENAWFAEKVIQYGNRYRGRDQELRISLEKAEEAFRNFEYKSALEQAATAVEAVEPGALKRIEDIYSEELG